MRQWHSSVSVNWRYKPSRCCIGPLGTGLAVNRLRRESLAACDALQHCARSYVMADSFDFSKVKWNVGLGDGVAGVHTSIDGKRCLIVCVNLDHAPLLGSPGTELEFAL